MHPNNIALRAYYWLHETTKNHGVESPRMEFSYNAKVRIFRPTSVDIENDTVSGYVLNEEGAPFKKFFFHKMWGVPELYVSGHENTEANESANAPVVEANALIEKLGAVKVLYSAQAEVAGAWEYSLNSVKESYEEALDENGYSETNHLLAVLNDLISVVTDYVDGLVK